MLAHVRENLQVFGEAKFVAQSLLDDAAKFLVVVRLSQIVCRAELESLDDAVVLRLFGGDDDGDEEPLAFEFGDDLRGAVGVLGEV